MSTMRLCVLTGTVAVLGLSTTGCASKGFVRSEMEGLRAEMAEEHRGLESQIDAVRDDVNDVTAMSAQAAQTADEARALALGDVDYREVERFRVYFDLDSASLDETDRNTLDQVAESMEQNPGYIVEVYGFADPSGSEDYNYALGARRAENVHRYLSAVTPGQLGRYHAVSFGETVPESEQSTIGTGAEMRQVLVTLVEPIPTAGESTAFNEILQGGEFYEYEGVQ
ncbi:MAG: OmpA family protein [Candidatus Eisenbacteria bacterium]|nr:OmpA family protein [Candidatus Eisenbacteria bacterium]